MTRREKTIGLAAGGMAAVLVSLFFGHRYVVEPAREAETTVLNLRRELNALRGLRQRAEGAHRRLSELHERTYGGDVDEATAQVGERLTEHISRVGLKDQLFTRLPDRPRKLRGGKEIGWAVQGVGPQKLIVDLLYMLRSEPQLHRIDNLSLRPTREAGQVAVAFRFSSIVLDGQKPLGGELVVARAGLGDPERRAFDVILERDLFLPVRRRVPPSVAVDAPQAGDGLGDFRVVSLSQWGGVPEAVILDVKKEETFSLRRGGKVADSTVVAVDYRRVQSKRRPSLVSFSRLILFDGTQYWAVETGGTLAERYALTPEELPPALKLEHPDKTAYLSAPRDKPNPHGSR